MSSMDQVLANVTTTYESALSAIALLNSSEENQAAARTIANAFIYALLNDNAGLPLPAATDGSTGLHNAYSSGDLALLNDQGPGAGQQGDVRLAGFTAGPEMCGGNGYCLVLDGATGGNNSFAMLALLAAYEHFQDVRHLNAARTIGWWMIGNLSDTIGSGYGGFYLGYPDEGVSPKTLIKSKSTENNADIFAALTYLATIGGMGMPETYHVYTECEKYPGKVTIQRLEATSRWHLADAKNPMELMVIELIESSRALVTVEGTDATAERLAKRLYGILTARYGYQISIGNSKNSM